MKIKMLEKIIMPVPPELKERFDDMQLQNSIKRLKILALMGALSIASNFVSYISIDKSLQLELEDLFKETLMNISTIIQLSLIVVFFLVVSLLKNKTIQWTLCYVFIASCFLLYLYNVYSLTTVVLIPPTVFITIFLFTMIPDFKPKAVVLYALLYVIALLFMLHDKYQSIDGYFESFGEYIAVASNCISIVSFVVITKILLYNSKVKNYVNTHKINSLNNELKNYNDNLEDMVSKKTATIVELKNAVMETMADLVERRDDVTGGHISRTSNVLKIVIDTMLKRGVYQNQTASWNIEQMILSAQLHDVGKIAIADSILRKPARLDENEFEKMKKHTVFGGDIIKEIQEKTSESEFLNYAYIFAVYHHEKWDGSGYPYGIAGEDIPLPARLMAIIDVYDALISERSYKKPFSHEEAMQIIKDGKGSHFDPCLVDVFIVASDHLEKRAA